jgi:copper resistance protein B
MRRSPFTRTIAGALFGLAAALPAAAAEMDDHVFTFFQAERLEYRLGDGDDSLHWDAQGWVGTDYHKLWLKTEGEKAFGDGLEEAEVQLLYSRIIHPFWDLQIGGRYDARPRPQRGFGVIGVQGLAPYFFEIDAAAFVSHEGDLSARLKGEYELLLTQQLILQPSVELDLAAQQVRDVGIGSGLTNVELGLRLRYEIIREFAPYVGIAWERKIGKTADFAKEEGEDADSLAVVTGVRFWF